MENLTIYNLPPAPPRWDRVGIFYISFCATWTALVFAGAAFCWFNRHSPVLRIRGLPLSLTAILFLHCYWVLAQITYPIGGTMNIVLAYDIQYFFMGIYFPLGIALIQASNMRFLHVANLQKRYADPDRDAGSHGCNGGAHSWLCKLRNMNYTKRIMIFIGVGMVFQVHTSALLCSYGNVLTVSGSSHCRHVAGLPQVPSNIWHPWHRYPRRYSSGADNRPGSGLGVVAQCSVAGHLDVDRKSSPPVLLAICTDTHRWRLSFSGEPGVSVILWDGAPRPSAAAFPSKCATTD